MTEKGSVLIFSDNYTRKAIVRKVIDGDTLELFVDNGYRRWSVERIRLSRIDAPEIRGIERASGLISKQFVANLLPEDTRVIIHSEKEDGFGRWLCELWYFTSEGLQQNLSDKMLEIALATTYER